MSDTSAIDDDSTMGQFFCGQHTLVCDVYGIKNLTQFVNALSDNIHKHGAMTTCITDGGKYEVFKKVTDILTNSFHLPI